MLASFVQGEETLLVDTYMFADIHRSKLGPKLMVKEYFVKTRFGRHEDWKSDCQITCYSLCLPLPSVQWLGTGDLLISLYIVL